MLDGADGPAVAMAMRILDGVGRAADAKRLIEVESAHIDGALYIGRASRDYAERLRDLGGRVRVRTTLNVSSLDLLHPELYRGDDETRAGARATMQAYEDMGCLPTWTCAPYQLEVRPALGERVAWAESNAIVFANSVLGARTERLGDFVDIAAALTGRVPEYGLYLDENRRATVEYDVSSVSERLRQTDQFFAVLGFLIGDDAGRDIPVVTGIHAATEDQLKVMGAAAATSGTVPLLHVVGITPEAATRHAATAGRPVRRLVVTTDGLRAARDSLSGAPLGAPLATVNLGTPHYSKAEIARLTQLLDGRSVHEAVSLYINTGRDVLANVANRDALKQQGVNFVTDTCTYLTPIIDGTGGVAMTDSAKWAYYAPANLGVASVFGSTADCVESAVAGGIRRDEADWR